MNKLTKFTLILNLIATIIIFTLFYNAIGEGSLLAIWDFILGMWCAYTFVKCLESYVDETTAKAKTNWSPSHSCCREDDEK